MTLVLINIQSGLAAAIERKKVLKPETVSFVVGRETNSDNDDDGDNRSVRTADESKK